jgi:hypothetical protein
MENQKFQKVPPFFLKIVPEFAKLSLLKVKKKKNSPKKFPQLHPSSNILTMGFTISLYVYHYMNNLDLVSFFFRQKRLNSKNFLEKRLKNR